MNRESEGLPERKRKPERFVRAAGKSLAVASFALFGNWANAVTFEFLVPPVPESAASVDAVFRISVSGAESAVGQPCFIGGEISVSSPNGSGPAAEEGADYIAPSPEFFDVLLQPGSGDVVEEFTLTIPIVNDQRVEPVQESYGLLFLAGEGSGGQDCFGTTIPADIFADAVISDDDALLYTYSPESITVDENSGSVTAELTLANPGDAPFQYSAVIPTSSQSGTAFAGNDFEAIVENLTFSESQTIQSMTVALIDDADVEGDEVFQIASAAGVIASDDVGNPFLISVTNAVAVTIVSDDVADVLSVTQTSLSVAEDGGTAEISVVRTGAAAGTVTVDYSTVAGSATENADYTAAAGVLTFGPGDLGPQQILVDLIDDLDDEVDETFVVELTNPQGAATLGAASSTITLTDNDEPPPAATYEFVNPSVSALESAGEAILSVRRVGDLSLTGSVDFESVDGSATDGSDFISAAGTLSFAPGEAGPLTLSVTIFDDSLSEADEGFALNLLNPVGGAVSATTGTADVFIIDNDNPGGTPEVSLQGAPDTQVLDSFSSSIVNAARTTDFTESSVNPASSNGTVTVNYQFAIPADANVGDVYQDRVVTSAGGQPGVVERYITIEVIEPVPASEGVLVFTSGELGLDENVGVVTLSVARINGAAGSISVDYSSSTVDAVLGEDFDLDPGTLSWADGEAGEKTFELSVLDDSIAEDPETLVVELGNFISSNGGNGPGLGDPSAITITINDDDLPGATGTVDFVEESITVDEEDGTVVVDVARGGSTVGAVSVDWATVADTAEEGGDFVAASGTLLWPDGDGDNKSITVELTADADLEGIEEFSITLSNPQGIAVGDVAVATVAISDVGQGLADVPGLNAEELAFATAFDSSCDNLLANADSNDADQQDLLFICGTVRSGLETPEQAREAIDALSGDELVTAATSTLKLLGLQHNSFRNRLSVLRSGNAGSFDVSGLSVEIDGQYLSGAVLEELFGALTGGAAGDDGFGRLSFYVNGRLDFGEKDRDSANRGYDFDAQMLTFGADYRLGDNMFIGAALGYEMADVDFAQGGALDVDGWKGSVYGSYFSGDAFFVDMQASYGRDDYSSERRIVYDYVGGTVDRTAEGDTKGDQFTFGISSGFDFNRGRLTFGPNVALSFFDVGVRSFTEEGAGGLNLTIGQQAQQSLAFTGGAHVSYVINTKLGVLIPNARIDYVHEFLNSPEFANVRFASDPLANDPSSLIAPLQVQAEVIDKDYLLWSVGSSMQFTHGISGYVNYQSTEGYSGLKLQQVAYGFRLERTY